ncbi:MAG TPA: ROK family protein [Ktedonobacterales bacterium]|nr:ROK family protein [Ktedonobacterales bacterium]
MGNPPLHNTNEVNNTIGIEFTDGGTRLAAKHAANGTIHRRRLAAPPTPEEAITALNNLIAEVIRDDGSPNAHPDALGVAVWGNVDPARGVTLGMPHREGWDSFPLAERLAGHWQAPVFLMPAAAAAGLAEATSGAGQHHRVVLYLHNGRTIASALIDEGAIFAGASGRAGQLAHWLVSPDGPRCACGQSGHLDPIASAQSIVRATIGLASGSDESTAAMLRVSGGRAEAMTVRQVVQLAEEGDPSARIVLERAWDALAVALVNLVATLDPDVIILGGPPAEAGDGFCQPLHDRLAILCGSWRTAPEILPGALGLRAALMGACLLPSHLRRHR